MKNGKRAEIISFLYQNSNENNKVSVDDIRKEIYVEDYGKTKEKIKDRRNTNRKTIKKNIDDLEEIIGGTDEIYHEAIIDEVDIKFKNAKWYDRKCLYYKHPIKVSDLKILTECILQLNSTYSDEKRELIEKISKMAGENLSKKFIESIRQTNPDYNYLQIIDERKERDERSNIIENLETIYSCLSEKVDSGKRNKISFKLNNYKDNGSFNTIQENEKDKVYKAFPLFVINSEMSFWLVSIMDTDTKNNPKGYHEKYNFSPLSLMTDITILDEKANIEDYPEFKEKYKEDIKRISREHQVGGQFLSYEEPEHITIYVKNKPQAYKLIYQTFGELVELSKTNKSDGSKKMMVCCSPWSLMKWAMLNSEYVEIADIEGPSRTLRERIKTEIQKISEIY